MERGDFDVIVVGAGVGGLSAAGLLAASGLEVLVIDHTSMPGGALGAFRRDGLTHDLGASMLFGFGEPVTMVRHRALYRLNYGGDPIVFWPEIDRYLAGLARVLPAERGASWMPSTARSSSSSRTSSGRTPSTWRRRRCGPAGIDIRGVLRRLEMENVEGARRRLTETGVRPLPCPSCPGLPRQRTRWAGATVPIAANLAWADGRDPC
jgi:hypothetical protein